MEPTDQMKDFEILSAALDLVWDSEDVRRFLIESLAIEGIYRKPTADEIQATMRFLGSQAMSTPAILDLQAVYAPGRPLRIQSGMNVYVGKHRPPRGGPEVRDALDLIAARSNGKEHPHAVHVAFELLHPFMDGNGRTGRALWAWQMNVQRMRPFDLPFLHRFYYQTLECAR